MTKDNDLALLDDDTLQAAYMKILEPFRFRVMVSCKDYCPAWEGPREHQTYWDPVTAIHAANKNRDTDHEVWIEIVPQTEDAKLRLAEPQ